MSSWKKINLYILSLAILFAFLAVINFPSPKVFFSDETQSILSKNILFLLSLLALLYCCYIYYHLEHSLKGSGELACKCQNLKQINYEHLTFLTTYVVPLAGLNLADTNANVYVGVFFLLVLIGAVYIKTDIFYQNPSLALLGFHIYSADVHLKANEQRKGIILITRTKLEEGQYVDYIKLDDRIYYARSCKGGHSNLKIND